ncbi:MAG: CPBP family intramembrane metalloprotease [Clostridiaceae bacterium]|nr:CPBP family intramembrane metalloprotease [Clostridiaceae bacterium]
MNKRFAHKEKTNVLTMGSITKSFKSIIWVLFLTILLLGIPRLATIIVSSLDFQLIDPDGAYAWLSVRHIVISLLVIILMGGINRIKLMDYGIGWGDKETGKKYTLLFFKYFCVYTTGAFITVIATNSFQQFEYPLTATNITGHLGFQLLLSGPAEELLFRGFAITMLAVVIRGRIFNGKISIANLIAAVIFGLAHIVFLFNPFEIRYSLFQVVYAIVLGLFYGDCYEKTNSVFYPMIMHSFTNVVMVGTIIILSFIL